MTLVLIQEFRYAWDEICRVVGWNMLRNDQDQALEWMMKLDMLEIGISLVEVLLLR